MNGISIGNQTVKNEVREEFDLRIKVVHNQLLDFGWNVRGIILLFLCSPFDYPH